MGFALLAIGLSPVFSVLAGPVPFNVQFEQTPLFMEANFLPGQDVDKWVDVTNNTSEIETIGVNAKNYTSCSVNCFSDQLKLKITDGAISLYEASLTDFFAAGEKKLSDVGAGDTQRYYFTITFVPDAGNQHQSNQVGFDFDIGIFGQETIGDGGDTGGGGTTGGGTFGGSTGLIIFNEASSPVIAGQTDITWETNHPATSRVIYSSQYETHVFDLNNPPNYGYLHSNVEDSSPVISHSMNISGLTPGVTYYYRVVSRGSFAISEEHSFTVPGILAAETGHGQENAGNTIALNQGTGGEENIENTEDGVVAGESTEEESQDEEGIGQFFLAALSGLFEKIDFCSVLLLLMTLVIAMLLWSLLDKKKEGENMKIKWMWSIASIIVLIILYGFFCPYYKILVIITIVLFVLFFLYRYFTRVGKSTNP